MNVCAQQLELDHGNDGLARDDHPRTSRPREGRVSPVSQCIDTNTFRLTCNTGLPDTRTASSGKDDLPDSSARMHECSQVLYSYTRHVRFRIIDGDELVSARDSRSCAWPAALPCCSALESGPWTEGVLRVRPVRARMPVPRYVCPRYPEH